MAFIEGTTFRCDTCGNLFTPRRPNRSLARKNHYCCTQCQYAGRRGRPNPNRKTGQEVACHFCGKVFYRKRDQLERNKLNFCSRECYLAHHGEGTVTRPCEWCNRPVTRPRSHKGEHFFCDHECLINYRLHVEDFCLKPTGHSRGKRVEYKGITFRSSWEAAFAKWLDESGLTWQYEGRKFLFTLDGRKRSYTPDFYVEEWGVWVDVKGYLTDEQARRIEAAKEQNPDLRLILLPEARLKMMGVFSYA